MFYSRFEIANQNNDMNITVIGPGCPNCKKLEAMCHEVVTELGIDANIEKITKVNHFSDFGVWLTPALSINGEVKVQGKMPTLSTLKGWIKNTM
jgi:small redox-active disulfide protein 2